MSALYQLATPLPETERNTRLYRGELIVFRGFDAMVQLTDQLRAHCIRYFGSDPTQVHHTMSSSEIEQANEALRTVIRKDSDVDLAWRQVLSAIHTDLDETYGDSMVIRVQPPRSGARGNKAR
ncbi:hypothetical protein [Marinobacter sp. HN1S83]|uniref:hypothetical protein n=1 Tax=Marinobacter sp. HN1S83 TaxID=3382301 RepID=UPI00387AD325